MTETHQSETRTLGGLTCRCFLPAGGIRSAVVINHGFGAPGDDLVPCGVEILHAFPEPFAETAFVFPEAPLSLAELGMPFGRAWWMIDMERLASATENLEMRKELVETEPQGLAAARDALLDVIAEVRGWGVAAERLVLCGFSQGAMLATETALHLERVGGLVIFSGALINRPRWQAVLEDPSRTRFPILQSHGRIDPILPFAIAEQLNELLLGAGYEAEFVPFDGPHTIPPAALLRAAQKLEEWVKP